MKEFPIKIDLSLLSVSIIGALAFVLVIYFLLISLIRELIAEKYMSNR
jgi:hypothetical protein